MSRLEEIWVTVLLSVSSVAIRLGRMMDGVSAEEVTTAAFWT